MLKTVENFPQAKIECFLIAGTRTPKAYLGLMPNRAIPSLYLGLECFFK